MSKNKAGFTLIEIMIVVGVILVIVALGLPSMLRSRMNANELAAVAACRIISNACQLYYTNDLPHSFPEGLNNLALPDSDPPYIDSALASGQKQGYKFEYSFVNSEAFTLRADPTRPGRTGARYFFVDETGLIRAREGGQAGVDDKPVSD